MMIDPRPTICQLVHSLDVGGAELLARDLAERSASRFRGVFVCLDRLGCMAERLSQMGYPCYVAQRGVGFDWRCIRRLHAILHRERVRLIHAHQFAPFFYGSCSRYTRAMPRVLFTEHGRDYPDYPRRKRIWANKLLLRRHDQVVAVGEGVKHALVSNEGIRADRIQVIRNGIDLARFGNHDRREAVRAELQIADNEIAIIQVARLHRLKDHGTAIRAISELVLQYAPVRLILVGDGDERPQLEALVDQLGLRERVHFLGQRTDIPDLLQAADIFLLTSLTEGIPLTLIEAMAAGLPCVSTLAGGTSEVVVEDKTGFLCPVGDSGQIAGRLRLLCENRELRHRLADCCRTRANMAFDGEAMHAAYHQLYDEMVQTGV